MPFVMPGKPADAMRWVPIQVPGAGEFEVRLKRPTFADLMADADRFADRHRVFGVGQQERIVLARVVLQHREKRLKLAVGAVPRRRAQEFELQIVLVARIRLKLAAQLLAARCGLDLRGPHRRALDADLNAGQRHRKDELAHAVRPFRIIALITFASAP